MLDTSDDSIDLPGASAPRPATAYGRMQLQRDSSSDASSSGWDSTPDRSAGVAGHCDPHGMGHGSTSSALSDDGGLRARHPDPAGSSGDDTTSGRGPHVAALDLHSAECDELLGDASVVDGAGYEQLLVVEGTWVRTTRLPGTAVGALEQSALLAAAAARRGYTAMDPPLPLVPVRGLGVSGEGALVSVTDAVPGVSLADLVALPARPPRLVQSVAAELLHALRDIHDEGIALGGFGVDSVFFDADGHVWFVDAVATAADRLGATDSSAVAPRMAAWARRLAAAGNADLDAALRDPHTPTPTDDVFSVGAAVAALIAGVPCFFGLSTVDAASAAELCAAAPAALIAGHDWGSTDKDFAELAAAFVRRCCGDDPHPTAAELLTDTFVGTEAEGAPLPESIDVAASALRRSAEAVPAAFALPSLRRRAAFEVRCTPPPRPVVTSSAAEHTPGLLVVTGVDVEFATAALPPDVVAGGVLAVRDVRGCRIVVAAAADDVVVDDAADSLIVVGPCARLVLRDVRSCRVLAAAQHVVCLGEVAECRLGLVSPHPLPPGLKGNTLEAYGVAYPGLARDAAAAGFPFFSPDLLLEKALVAPLEVGCAGTGVPTAPWATNSGAVRHVADGAVQLWPDEAGALSVALHGAGRAPPGPPRLHVVLDALRSAELRGLVSCTVVVAAVCDELRVVDCRDVEVHAVCGTLRLAGCDNVRISVWCAQGVVAQQCAQCVVGPLRLALPQLPDLVATAGLPTDDGDGRYDVLAGHETDGVEVARDDTPCAMLQLPGLPEPEAHPGSLAEVDLDATPPGAGNTCVAFCGLTDAAIFRAAGEVFGGAGPGVVRVQGVRGGFVHIADAVADLIVDDCHDMLEVAVAAATRVTVRGSSSVTVHVACRELGVAQSRWITVAAHSEAVPTADAQSEHLTVGPLNMAAPMMEDLLAAAGVPLAPSRALEAEAPWTRCAAGEAVMLTRDRVATVPFLGPLEDAVRESAGWPSPGEAAAEASIRRLAEALPDGGFGDVRPQAAGGSGPLPRGDAQGSRFGELDEFADFGRRRGASSDSDLSDPLDRPEHRLFASDDDADQPRGEQPPRPAARQASYDDWDSSGSGSDDDGELPGLGGSAPAVVEPESEPQEEATPEQSPTKHQDPVPEDSPAKSEEPMEEPSPAKEIAEAEQEPSPLHETPAPESDEASEHSEEAPEEAPEEAVDEAADAQPPRPAARQASYDDWDSSGSDDDGELPGLGGSAPAVVEPESEPQEEATPEQSPTKHQDPVPEDSPAKSEEPMEEPSPAKEIAEAEQEPSPLHETPAPESDEASEHSEEAPEEAPEEAVDEAADAQPPRPAARQASYDDWDSSGSDDDGELPGLGGSAPAVVEPESEPQEEATPEQSPTKHQDPVPEDSPAKSEEPMEEPSPAKEIAEAEQEPSPLHETPAPESDEASEHSEEAPEEAPEEAVDEAADAQPPRPAARQASYDDWDSSGSGSDDDGELPGLGGSAPAVVEPESEPQEEATPEQSPTKHQDPVPEDSPAKSEETMEEPSPAKEIAEAEQEPSPLHETPAPESDEASEHSEEAPEEAPEEAVDEAADAQPPRPAARQASYDDWDSSGSGSDDDGELPGLGGSAPAVVEPESEPQEEATPEQSPTKHQDPVPEDSPAKSEEPMEEPSPAKEIAEAEQEPSPLHETPAPESDEASEHSEEAPEEAPEEAVDEAADAQPPRPAARQASYDDWDSSGSGSDDDGELPGLGGSAPAVVEPESEPQEEATPEQSPTKHQDPVPEDSPAKSEEPMEEPSPAKEIAEAEQEPSPLHDTPAPESDEASEHSEEAPEEAPEEAVDEAADAQPPRPAARQASYDDWDSSGSGSDDDGELPGLGGSAPAVVEPESEPQEEATPEQSPTKHQDPVPEDSPAKSEEPMEEPSPAKEIAEAEQEPSPLHETPAPESDEASEHSEEAPEEAPEEAVDEAADAQPPRPAARQASYDDWDSSGSDDDGELPGTGRHGDSDPLYTSSSSTDGSPLRAAAVVECDIPQVPLTVADIAGANDGRPRTASRCSRLSDNAEPLDDTAAESRAGANPWSARACDIPVHFGASASSPMDVAEVTGARPATARPTTASAADEFAGPRPSSSSSTSPSPGDPPALPGRYAVATSSDDDTPAPPARTVVAVTGAMRPVDTDSDTESDSDSDSDTTAPAPAAPAAPEPCTQPVPELALALTDLPGGPDDSSQELRRSVSPPSEVPPVPRRVASPPTTPRPERPAQPFPEVPVLGTAAAVDALLSRAANASRPAEAALRRVGREDTSRDAALRAARAGVRQSARQLGSKLEAFSMTRLRLQRLAEGLQGPPAEARPSLIGRLSPSDAALPS